MIHTFLVRTDIDDTLLARLTALLSPAEQARALRFRQAADRRRHVVARATVKTLLTDRLARKDRGQTSISDLQFDIGPHGKPALPAGSVDASTAAPLHFNLSHSGDLALIAIAPVPVGIDLERDAPPDADALARTWFTPAEQVRLQRGEADFLTLWTAREAVLKAAGTGLSADPLAFSVPALSGAGFDPVRTAAGHGTFARYRVARLDLRDACPALPPAFLAPYRAAVALCGDAMPVQLHHFDAAGVARRVTLRAVAPARVDALCPHP
jgi:4'-phosphopantetheinyl transferase